jgi:uncharacterized protein (DUF362 family)
MLSDRRTFLKTTAALGGAVLLRPGRIFGAEPSADFFGVHPFIESNPNAVFIMKTSVDSKMNSDAKKQAGLAFGKSAFVPLAEGSGGVPLTRKVVIKPNLTERSGSGYTIERAMGIITDAYFVEGVIESMKSMGLSGGQFYLREVNGPAQFDDGGYIDMAERTGADIRDLDANVNSLPAGDVVWKDVPNGVWFNRIPYLWPVNAPDTFLINIAKFKAHSMGVTLCAKNLQGSIASPYQGHCTAYNSEMKIPAADVRSGAKTTIMANYNRHNNAGIPRWDKPGYDHQSGLGQEIWASRCLDNNSVTKPRLHIIEGIYGHDGNFLKGPGPGGFANDFMTNVIIFGKNPFHVDIIGHWLANHEPGNFGLFHIAIERGLSNFLNPKDIPLYEWTSDGTATMTPLEQFTRTSLLTYYLQRNYNGQSEEYWHLCNEPYTYPPSGVDPGKGSDNPESFALSQNFPNPFNPSTSIAFLLPRGGHARIEILNARGEIVDVPADRYFEKGAHQLVWRAGGFPSGLYFYRLWFGTFVQTRKMTLAR